jgi:hypothetical protein
VFRNRRVGAVWWANSRGESASSASVAANLRPPARRIARVLVVAAILFSSALLVSGCWLAKEQPQIVRDLVAVAPAGSEAAVDYAGPMVEGQFVGWVIRVESGDVPADLLAYRQWLEGQGFSVKAGVDGADVYSMWLRVCGTSTNFGTEENPDTERPRIVISIDDGDINTNGDLVVRPEPDCP